MHRCTLQPFSFLSLILLKGLYLGSEFCWKLLGTCQQDNCREESLHHLYKCDCSHRWIPDKDLCKGIPKKGTMESEWVVDLNSRRTTRTWSMQRAWILMNISQHEHLCLVYWRMSLGVWWVILQELPLVTKEKEVPTTEQLIELHTVGWKISRNSTL